MKKIMIASVCAVSLVGGVSVAAIAQKGPALERVDANGDGNITIAELEAQKTERFSSADTNGDNLMSFDEFEAQIEADKDRREAERNQRRFERLDANSDGFVTAEEHAAAGDERMQRRFDRVDTNGDGMISSEEREAAKATMKDRRRQGRGQRAG